MDAKGNDMALTVKISKGGAITIRFTKADLARGARLHPDITEFDDDTGRYLHPKIIDAAALAQDVYNILEDGDGGADSALLELLDNAILEAVEAGCEGVITPSDDDYGRKAFVVDA